MDAFQTHKFNTKRGEFAVCLIRHHVSFLCLWLNEWQIFRYRYPSVTVEEQKVKRPSVSTSLLKQWLPFMQNATGLVFFFKTALSSLSRFKPDVNANFLVNNKSARLFSNSKRLCFLTHPDNRFYSLSGRCFNSDTKELQ